MDIKSELNQLSLTPDNTVIIGSGILSALGIRQSEDIDAIVTGEKYEELCGNTRFKKAQNHGREVLADSLFEIGISWMVMGKTWKYDDLLPHSTLIDGVRYNSVEFLLNTKKSWVKNGEARQKDMDDIKLMEKYLAKAD